MAEAFDVIVVGGGGSGLAAALSAAEAGGRVLLLEKRSQLGGTTAIAVGSYTAAETECQRAQGIVDSAAAHAEDAGLFAPPEIEARNNASLRSHVLTEAADTLAWLESLGLSFVGPSPKPPNRVPRMHNVVPGARAYIAALSAALKRRGATIRLGAAVNGITSSADGVTGVEVQLGGQSRDYLAKRAVILAAGDYANDPELIGRYKGEAYREVEGINPFATGDGQRLAERAGASLLNMDVTYGPELRLVAPKAATLLDRLPASGVANRLLAIAAAKLPRWVRHRVARRLLVTWQHPEDALLDDGAILINRDGRRFTDECTSPGRELVVARQPEKLAYLLLDGRLVERYSAWPHFIWVQLALLAC